MLFSQELQNKLLPSGLFLLNGCILRISKINVNMLFGIGDDALLIFLMNWRRGCLLG